MRQFNVVPEERIFLSSTSKGNQDKWIVRQGSSEFYLKANQFGYEGIAEALVAEFLSYIEDVDFVDYSLCTINENGRIYYGCYSESMLRSYESLVSVYKVLKLAGVDLRLINRLHGKELLSFIISTVNTVCSLDITSFIQQQINLDSIIYNEDRHLNNLSLVYNSVTKKYSCAPIFDNGLSLLSDIGDYAMGGNIDFIIRKVKAKPFSTDFKKQVLYFKFNPLKIHIGDFERNLDSYFIEGYPQEEYFERAKEVLLFGLKRMEGLSWIPV